MTDATAQIIRVIGDYADFDQPITLGDTLENLNLDPLDMLDITFTLDDLFDIEITDEDAESLRTVGDLTALVDRLCQGVGA